MVLKVVSYPHAVWINTIRDRWFEWKLEDPSFTGFYYEAVEMTRMGSFRYPGSPGPMLRQ